MTRARYEFNEVLVAVPAEGRGQDATIMEKPAIYSNPCVN